jgi:hypothetical protein
MVDVVYAPLGAMENYRLVAISVDLSANDPCRIGIEALKNRVTIGPIEEFLLNNFATKCNVIYFALYEGNSEEVPRLRK